MGTPMFDTQPHSYTSLGEWDASPQDSQWRCHLYLAVSYQITDSPQTWQAKLTERKVAIMPWDPAPAPPSAPQPSTSQPVPTVTTTSQPDSKPQPGASSPAAATSSSPPIKNEPSSINYDLQNLPGSNSASALYNSSPAAALDRTSQQLHEKFGASAATQINQLQARRAMMSQSASSQPTSTQVPKAELDARRREYELQQQQRHKAQMAAQQQRSLGSAQTDGAGDWASFVTARRAEVAADAGAADHSLREMLNASSLQMEGGGLMQPVRRARPSKARRAMAGQASSTSSIRPHGQFDGPDDDSDDKDGIKDEDDEDAINSELDDSEDELDQEEDDEDANQGEIMLCTYDKVQRVKNKWKCTLKDGVLTTGGKE